MFLHEAKQIPRTYLLLRPCSPKNSKKVFSRSNFSDNSVQVPSSIHSNVQLLYLLLFLDVGVAVLVAKGPYYISVAAKLFIIFHELFL